ncbi:DUF4857 domain-containing protein [Marinilabiliaceae bacterium ANBcel2]|nr:DUF4857 domain-containing protein [Marinilabiliaceae bacterium ANBcel2]
MKTIKAILIVITTLIFAWVLPWIYDLSTDTPQNYPFTYYSSVAETFGMRKNIDGETVLKDDRGNEYSEAQFDSILPMLYYRQLARDGHLPDSLHGVDISQRLLSNESFVFRYRPRDKNSPSIPLYTLIESMPRRVDLEMPGDMFRLDDEIQFIKPETNTVDWDKSSYFNEMLNRRGFVWPANIVAGNPTTRKSYDEGYLITDNNHNLYHFKMVNSRPYLQNIELCEDVIPVWLEVTEYRSRNYYGFVISQDGRLFVIHTGGYRVEEIPVPSFNPQTDNLLIMGNLFYWNIQVTTANKRTIYAVCSNSYDRVNSITFDAPDSSDNVKKGLFPFEISFTSSNDAYVYPRVQFFGFYYLALSLLLALGYIVFTKRANRAIDYFSLILIALTGFIGVASVLTVGDLKHV